MQKTSESFTPAYPAPRYNVVANDMQAPASILLCNWNVLRMQLLQQWTMITPAELIETGPNCRRIASLIARKYNIAPSFVENYLRNFERTIPLL